MRLSKSSNKRLPRRPVDEPEISWQFEAIGTQWWIGVYEPVASDMLESLQVAVNGRVARFDTLYSRFRDDSLVAHMAESAGDYAMPVAARRMLTFYRELYDLTDGAVTPLVGQLLADAGYDANYSLKPGILRPVPSWDQAMVYANGVLRLKQPVLLDFGALGKGYLIDIVARLLRGAGLRAFCVDASGDMIFDHANRSLRVGLEDPDDATQVIGVAALRGGQALCGSAGNRRTWAGYHHIFDPRTRQPANDVKAVWVVADEAMVADGLTTALFFVPPAQVVSVFTCEYLIMYQDGRIARSDRFPAELFS